MSRLHALSSIVFAITLIIYGYIQWQKSNEQSAVPLIKTDTPDFIAKSLSSNQYDSNGKLSHTIYADEMTHFADKSETTFVNPKFTALSEEDKPSWTLSAQSGQLFNNKLTFSNRVRVVSSDKNSFIREIHGKSITMDLLSNIITSEQTILLKGKDFTMYGSGLNVDTHSTKMTISEHVQTIYKKHAN